MGDVYCIFITYIIVYQRFFFTQMLRLKMIDGNAKTVSSAMSTRRSCLINSINAQNILQITLPSLCALRTRNTHAYELKSIIRNFPTTLRDALRSPIKITNSGCGESTRQGIRHVLVLRYFISKIDARAHCIGVRLFQ